jgi:hypothetical protein
MHSPKMHGAGSVLRRAGLSDRSSLPPRPRSATRFPAPHRDPRHVYEIGLTAAGASCPLVSLRPTSRRQRA